MRSLGCHLHTCGLNKILWASLETKLQEIKLALLMATCSRAELNLGLAADLTWLEFLKQRSLFSWLGISVYFLNE